MEDRSTERMVGPCILGAERGDQGNERVATPLASEARAPGTLLTREVSTTENLVAIEARMIEEPGWQWKPDPANKWGPGGGGAAGRPACTGGSGRIRM